MKDYAPIKKIGVKGNESYLCQDDKQRYPLLSELFVADYEIFSNLDMSNLIEELTKLSHSLHNIDDIRHINDIISLAYECASHDDMSLCFNPFIE